jgi:spore germination protein KB
VSEKTSISPGQLLVMMLLFEFGTAMVVPVGLKAMQATWLSILIAAPGGIVLYLIYESLNRRHRDLVISGYMSKILGKYIGLPLSVLYNVFFIYMAARVLRDGGDLLITASYDRTPIFVIHAVMIIAVIYVLHKGIEVFFRLGQIYIFIVCTIGFLSGFAVLLSGKADFGNLLPIAGEGWPSVLQAAYPNIMLFPYGELVVFTTVLPHLNHAPLARKTGILAILFSGMTLSAFHAMQVAVLGIDIYSRATFPLFTSIGLVKVAEFLQRLDALVILTLIIGVFFKVAMFCYGAMAVAADIFRVEQPSKLAFPIGIIVLFMSIFIAWSFPEHLEEGAHNITFNLVFFCIIVPVLLLVVDFVRKHFNQ